MARKAVFLDRDGTIIPETGALKADPHVAPLPEAVTAIRKLRKTGFLIVVVTNQAAIARGCFTETDLAAAHKALLKKFEDAGAPINALYYCPHLPEGVVPEYAIPCDCRKPRPGLFYRAAKQLDIRLSDSYMIGDSERDIAAAHAAGCKGAALIRAYRDDTQVIDPGTDPQWVRITEQLNKAAESEADAIVPDVAAAADWILEMEETPETNAENQTDD